MKQTMKLKSVALVPLLLAAFGAQAAQKDITVTASVDAAIDMVQSDGTALPSTIAMDYLPGSGLAAKSLSVKFFTNDTAKNVDLALIASPQLGHLALPAKTVPLTVKYNGQALTTTATNLTAASLFPSGYTVATGSVAKQLEISQTTAGVLDSGNYSGVVSLLITQP